MQKTTIALFLIMCSVIIPQSNTFYRTNQLDGNIISTVFDENEYLYQLLEVNQDNHIQLYVAKYDELGIFLGKSANFEVPENYNSSNISKFKNNFLVFPGLDPQNGKSGLVKLNEDLEFTGHIHFTEFDTLNLMEIRSNSAAISIFMIDSQKRYRFAYIDESENLSWIKKLDDVVHSNFLKYFFSLAQNGNLLISYKNKYHNLFSPGGTLLWETETSFKYVSSIKSDIFYINHMLKMKKMQINIGELWEITLPDYPDFIPAVLSNNNVISYSKKTNYDSFAIYDPSGNQVDLVDINLKHVTKSIECSQNYIVSTSTSTSSTVQKIAKFTLDGILKYITLNLEFRDYIPQSKISIEWELNDISFIDIYFSEDSENWEKIIYGYPVEIGFYSWFLPEDEKSLYFKIVNSEDTRYYDVSLRPIKVTFKSFYDYMEANNTLIWTGADGRGSFDPFSGEGGFRWNVAGEDKYQTVYSEGPVLGFKNNNVIKVYAATYESSFLQGKLWNDGTYTSGDNPYFSVYQTAKNWEDLPQGEERAKFENAYNNWPVDIGAPFIDHNDNGTYEPEIDEPDLEGDRMMWFINHTADSAKSVSSYGSYGDNIEVQTSVWASEDLFPDVVFKKFKIINKEDEPLENFYFGYWADPDLGFSGDDYAGYDSLHQMAYVFNGDDNDDDYFLDNPPATGFMLLDGPIVPGEPEDLARYGGDYRLGYKNLPVTSFAFYINSNEIYADPELGTYNGSIQMYNYLQGYSHDGEPFIDPNTSATTKFPLSGNPFTKIGWYEGGGWPGGPPAGDRRMIISSGPFEFPKYDVQIVSVAILNAQGTDRIQSVIKLKALAESVRNYWNNSITTSLETGQTHIPEKYQLAQNYPNPFNPSTVIEFSLPEQANVQLEVFNILGEKVTDLVNTEMQPGVHKVDFNGEGLASGLYIYRLIAGDVNLVRKMMLLK